VNLVHFDTTYIGLTESTVLEIAQNCPKLELFRINEKPGIDSVWDLSSVVFRVNKNTLKNLGIRCNVLNDLGFLDISAKHLTSLRLLILRGFRDER